MPIFLKVNHQLESRMQEICQSGSEGGAKPICPYPYLNPGFEPWGTCAAKRGALKGRQVLVPDVAFIESDPISFQECAKLVLECHPVLLSNFYLPPFQGGAALLDLFPGLKPG